MQLIDAGFAFAEGVGLIASPCILPVLPLVLSTSVEGGRKRPFGIITGFVLAFTFFVLASRKLVSAFNINLDLIKDGSLILLVLFALVLLSEKLSAKFSNLTQGAANLGNSLSANGKEGFISGVALGVLIGLIWTPCAGPILAAVLVQVILQKNDAFAFLTVASFALGAGLPMLVIALMGRKIMGRLGFFTKHAEAVRKAFGVIILCSVAFIASGIDAQGTFASSASTLEGDSLQKPVPQSYPAPEITGIDGWINSNPLTMASLKGKVVLIDFWTYSCVNCVRTLPYITKWDEKYKDKGLVIIGISAPEFEFEKNADNVKAAVEKHGIHYPVALDNHLVTWGNFNNQYWPAHYLIDKQGNVVYTHFGEGDYDITENNIRYLLGLHDKTEITAPHAAQADHETPETYLGMERAERFASTDNVIPYKDIDYHFPEQLHYDHWALQGTWRIESEKIVAGAKGAALRFHFTSPNVFLVLGSASNQPVHAHVTLDTEALGANAGKDAPHGNVTVAQHTLYELVRQPASKSGIVEITADEPGLEAYAFTFGN